MPARTLKSRFSEAEYLAQERVARGRSEYFKGEILLLPTPDRMQQQIRSNIRLQLVQHAPPQGYTLLAPAHRVHVPSEQFFAYPDVSLTLGDPLYLDNHFDTCLNPATLVELVPGEPDVEVLVQRLRIYQSIRTLREYVVVCMHLRQLYRWHRTGLQNNAPVWSLDETVSGEIWIANCPITLNQMYLGVILNAS